MTKKEFIQVFMEFNENFNNAYSQRQIDKLWNYVEILEANDFKFRLEWLMDECIKAPGIGKIRGFLADCVNRARSYQKEEIKKTLNKCLVCEQTGMVSGIDLKPGQYFLHKYGFRCGHCRIAEILGLSREIPLWYEEGAGSRFANENWFVRDVGGIKKIISKSQEQNSYALEIIDIMNMDRKRRGVKEIDFRAIGIQKAV